MNDRPIYLLWFKNTKTNKFNSFNTWAESNDEALENVQKDFFDNPNLTSFELDKDFEENKKYSVNKDKDILYTSEFMKLIQIERFEPNEIEKMCKKRNKDGTTKYINP